jgi:sulfoxide reductase heme-binding subunit YedZ
MKKESILKPILTSKGSKFFVFLLCLIPLAKLFWKAIQQELGPNPIEFATHFTGDWILIFLVITLSVTPARKVFHRPELIRFRRMLGLFAFFYACLHFLIWCVLDKFFDFPEMWKDVLKRPFITAGFLGWGLLVPLAITSTAGWIRRLGKRWRTLHRLVYISAAAGVVHYYWLVKSDVRKPLRYATILALLLLFRAAIWLYSKRTNFSLFQVHH